ncbi:MAG: magnesium-translocating P-type ATPase, partial [Propionibacteriaceae bacterium]|nr:magnesium-translocating P-type ATPase [Propionibacteriaceae bacterium]
MLATKNQDQLALQRVARVRRRLLSAASRDPETLLLQYDTSLEGFDPEQVDDARHQYGRNIVAHRDSDTVLRQLRLAFINPFTIVLFVLAAASFVTDFLLADDEKDLTTVIIVLTMVTIAGLVRFNQENRNQQAARKLTEMVETTIAVQRVRVDDHDKTILVSERQEIPLDEVVVGDLVYLAAGDMIPADVRIIQAKDLFVSQSSLTGESEPVEKFAVPINGQLDQPLSLNNLAFMGSNVVSGSAMALVIAVGDSTTFGQLALQLQTRRPENSFEKGIRSVSWVLIRFMLVMVPVILFINGFTKGDWMESFLFAISVAVGLTPEMLPTVVAANLAKGAMAMAREKVIVKELSSIQNFGAMDILCTDKTGTLTQDRVILEYHLNVDGVEDERVLRHAFLNSYHQTGLKNLMDHAIIEVAHTSQLVEEWMRYDKVDEIPFDFNRRRMSVVVADETGKTQIITKGAIEEMLAVSSYVEIGGEVLALTEAMRQRVLADCRERNADGLRVLGLAQRTDFSPTASFSVSDEVDMVLIGYLAFLDPPKESAGEAIAALHDFGVEVKVLTGDNDAVTRCVCRQVGIATERILLGNEIDGLSDEELARAAQTTNVFAKLTPQHKARIVAALRAEGHVVGLLGDGINDAAAMRAADVGISVDTAVDIAKESANIILLEKDLMVLEHGVVEGRKTYANTIKYIKMTASSNFGNVLSILAACVFLPFLPMLPAQILTLNLIYDISCLTTPWDNVDRDYLRKPRRWDASSITRFMLWLGPVSSVFDITTYLAMFWLVCPAVFGASYHDLLAAGMTGEALGFMALFHAGWFVESLWSQTLVIHMLRTKKIPFLQSRPSWQVVVLTTMGIAFGTALPFLPGL